MENWTKNYLSSSSIASPFTTQVSISTLIQFPFKTPNFSYQWIKLLFSIFLINEKNSDFFMPCPYVWDDLKKWFDCWDFFVHHLSKSTSDKFDCKIYSIRDRLHKYEDCNITSYYVCNMHTTNHESLYFWYLTTIEDEQKVEQKWYAWFMLQRATSWVMTEE